MTEIISNEVLEDAAEQIRAIDVERNYRVFREQAEQHHEIGETMDALIKKGMDKVLLVKYLIDHGAAKETTLYVSHQFYTRWPNLEDMYTELKIEKALSWNYVRAQLQAPKEKEEKETDDCRHCIAHGCPPPRKSIGGGVI